MKIYYVTLYKMKHIIVCEITINVKSSPCQNFGRKSIIDIEKVLETPYFFK